MNRKPLGLLTLCATIALGACTNPETPAGHEGYIYYKPLIFGKMQYRETLTGPSSTGVAWRLYAINIDVRPRNYKEPFHLLTSDDLKISFEVNTRIRLRANSVQQVVEEYGAEYWYEWNVKERLRTIVRTTVVRLSATDVQLKTEQAENSIREKLDAKFKGTPVEILSVDVGDIQFPERVKEAIKLKISAQQELDRQQYVLSKTKKEAAIDVLNALKEAKQQQIISSTLDPLYVQRRAIDVYARLPKSKNKTIIVLPNRDDGTGMPLVTTAGKRKPLTAADRELLNEMEERYMRMAAPVLRAGKKNTPATTVKPKTPAKTQPEPSKASN